MTYQISSDNEYHIVMEKVETYLQLATKNGGFHALDAHQRADLQNLSTLAEAWEDNIPLMPIVNKSKNG
jgi:HTH-type transcriptional regulator / antitoxin HigA